MAYYESYYKTNIKKRFNALKGLSTEDFKNGSTQIAVGADKIKQNIITLLSVNQGEVFFNPGFGSNIYSLLFEPNDFILKDTLDRFIRSQINKYIEDVKVEEINIDIEDTIVNINIHYTILSIGYYDEVAIIKKRGGITYD